MKSYCNVSFQVFFRFTIWKKVFFWQVHIKSSGPFNVEVIRYFPEWFDIEPIVLDLICKAHLTMHIPHKMVAHVRLHIFNILRLQYAWYKYICLILYCNRRVLWIMIFLKYLMLVFPSFSFTLQNINSNHTFR